jgi:hypothetical protein
VAETFEITADSLDILAPDERLERVFAAGRARSVSTDRDSLTVASLPDIAKTDWLEGDTIVVTFVTDVDPAATADTIPGVPQPDRESQVDRIVAIVDARSLYRLSPSDPAAVAGEDPPAVHYVVGDRITIVMQEGQVDRLEVEGQTTGIHLEPLPRGGTNR